jgi:integrase
MVVRYGKITKRFDNYPAALQFLTGLRFQEGSGQFDARDYQVKAKPLSFETLADEWLELKAKQIKPSSLRSLLAGMTKAKTAWGQQNIKGIKYPQIEDFINAYPGAPKSKSNALAALKQFFAWAHDRYDIPEIKKWPKLGYIEMAFRETVDLDSQQMVIDDIKEHEPFRVWLCIKWLATYIAVRPGEMQNLKESEVDRQRGIIIFPHPKEKRAKIIPLIPEDIEIVRSLPLTFDRNAFFFRHESGSGGTHPGQHFGGTRLYHAWRDSCRRLGVEGVSVYPGTKHSTAMGLRAVATPEEIRAMTLHSTSEAFNRYFNTSGEPLRDLLGRRKTVISDNIPDNGLITVNGSGAYSQVIDFTKNMR